MRQEIERKYLVVDDSWRDTADPGTLVRQGYLSTDPDRSVRVRILGRLGLLTIKGRSRGATRSEFEYEIPVDQAGELLDGLCLRPMIEKVRYRVRHENVLWEIDVFRGDNEGLILAEVELTSEDQTFALPTWVGLEVTDDPRYYNAALVSRPYSTWPSPR